jgi:hypothetical protein
MAESERPPVHRHEELATERSRHSLRLAAILGLAAFLVAVIASAALDEGRNDYEVSAVGGSAPNGDPSIIVVHSAPEVVLATESVALEFRFVCATAPSSAGRTCKPSGHLYAAWGSGGFSEQLLQEQDLDTLTVYTAQLPASTASGSLRYFLEVSGGRKVISRTPEEGSIDLLVVDSPVEVKLPEPLPRDDSEILVEIPWGDGPDRAGTTPSGDGILAGPDSFDVGDDGTIAISDPAHDRILVRTVNDSQFQSIPVPLSGVSDVAVLRDGSIEVLDISGQEAADGSRRAVLTHLTSGGRQLRKGEVVAQVPSHLEPAGGVVDAADGQVIPASAVLNGGLSGQRVARGEPSMPVRLVGSNDALLGDSEGGVGFHVTTGGQLGPIAAFEALGHGRYAVAFELGDLTGMRVAVFGADGTVLSDALLPNNQFSVFNPLGRVAFTPDGRAYVLTSSEAGVQVIGS